MSKLEELVILGRKIGTVSGWDGSDDFAVMAYDFVPYKGINLPKGDLNFDFLKGTVQTFDDIRDNSKNGEVIDTIDLVEAIMILPNTTMG